MYSSASVATSHDLYHTTRTHLMVESPRGPYGFGSVGVVASCLSANPAPQLRQNVAVAEIPAPHRGQRAAAPEHRLRIRTNADSSPANDGELDKEVWGYARNLFAVMAKCQTHAEY